ncbi:MAG: 50S ribosomal protein L13 [Elusimicrobia bacterium]|nr:50S ribosomal protein L13 [Elusimicrobiota bacterium]
MPQKTWMPVAKDFESSRKWHFLDAQGQVLGRLASRMASLLMGKGKPQWVSHLDCGDFVVVTNASKICLTGQKMNQKFYFRHSGHASGAKTIPVRDQLSKDPRKIIYLAVKRMLDSNRLRTHQLRRLKIYPGEQQPFPVPKSLPTGQVDKIQAEAKT